MMLPILISVSVAPVSYFFWADAVEAEAAMSASASDAAASLPVTAGIPISLFSWCVCVPFLVLLVFGDAAAIQYDLPDAYNRKPLRRVAGAASLVVRGARAFVCDCEKVHPSELMDRSGASLSCAAL